MKKRILGLLIALVALVSTVGVGFASWVISKPAVEVEQGTIQVDAVVEQALKVNLTWGTMEGTTFSALELNEGEPLLNLVGPTTNSVSAGNWLTYTGSYPARLSVTLKIEVKDANNKLFTGKVFVSEGNEAGDELAAGSKLSEIIGSDQDLVVAPTYVGSELKTGNHAGAYEVAVTNGVGYFTITLAWGSHFNGNNPYDFYNAQGHEADAERSENLTYADDAKASLGALATMLGGTAGSAASKLIGYTVYASASDATAWSE